MRRGSFLSIVVIIGTMFGIVAVVAFWLLGVVTRVSFRGDALMAFLFLFVAFGLPMGLFMGYELGPTTRTFNCEFSEDFRGRLEESLRSRFYHLHNESPSRLTYHSARAPFLADIIVDSGTSPVRVSGPRQILRNLEKKIREAKT